MYLLVDLAAMGTHTSDQLISAFEVQVNTSFGRVWQAAGWLVGWISC
jgi:beta-lactamase class D